MSQLYRPHSFKSLQQDGFFHITYPFTDKNLQEVFETFTEAVNTCAEQSESGIAIDRAFRVETPGRPGDSHGFIERRVDNTINGAPGSRGLGTSNKDILHFTPLTVQSVTEQLGGRANLPVTISRILTLCSDPYSDVAKTVRPLTRGLQLEDTLFAPVGEQNVHILRMIRYIGNTATNRVETPHPDSLAILHFDYSVLTASLGSTGEGLVDVPSNNLLGRPETTAAMLASETERAVRTPIHTPSGTQPVFVGAGYNRLPLELRMQSGELQPLLHGVIDTNPDVDRYAAVTFINHHTGHSSWGTPSRKEAESQDLMAEVGEPLHA